MPHHSAATALLHREADEQYVLVLFMGVMVCESVYTMHQTEAAASQLVSSCYYCGQVTLQRLC
ncbi:MAG: hypothetical protein EOM68_23440 [Spirochaetia bacterium]|nr:hypothetical protein [Spirochaetia bacterium]